MVEATEDGEMGTNYEQDHCAVGDPENPKPRVVEGNWCRGPSWQSVGSLLFRAVKVQAMYGAVLKS